MDSISKSEKFHHTCRHRRRRSQPIVEVFQPNVRPDLVIVQNRQIFVLELTVCHETNLVNSFKYKTEKYKNLNQFLQPKFINFPVNYFPFEISVHGFMTNNLRTFLANIKLHEFPLNLQTKMIRSVIFSSFDIYKHRDIQWFGHNINTVAKWCCSFMNTSR